MSQRAGTKKISPAGNEAVSSSLGATTIQSFPAPSISVIYTKTITLGQSATINLTATNSGGIAGYQTINTSFPTNISSSDVSIIATDVAYNYVLSPGKNWYACYGQCNVTLQYPMAEAVAYNWTGGAKHYLDVRVTPTTTGDFTFYIKSVASPYLSYLACCSDPAGGTTDQQHEYVYVETILVNPPSTSGSFTLGVSPSSRTINPGGKTTYDVTVSAESGFNSNVLLSVHPEQEGIYCSFTSFSSAATSCQANVALPYPSAKLYVTTSTSVPVGKNTLFLNGTSSGSTNIFGFTLRVSSPPAVMSDSFTKESTINSSVWRINSPVLSNVVQQESGYFGEPINLVAPSSMSFSSSGLSWTALGAQGAQGVSGLTTQGAITPPFTVEMDVTPNGALGAAGNPVAVYISNAKATTLFTLYLSGSQVCIADQGSTPSCGSIINQGQEYKLSFSVNTTDVNATVNGVGTSFSQTLPLTQSGDYAYYISIGTFAGQIPGVEGGSTIGYADSAIFSSFQIDSTFLRNLKVTVDANIQNGPSGPSSGAIVNLTNIVTGASYTGLTNSAGQFTFNDLVTGTYTLTANQSCGAPGCTAMLANSTTLVIGNPSNPSSTNLGHTLTIDTPSIPPLILTTISLGPVVGIYPVLHSVNFSAIPYGGVGNYVVNWTENGVTILNSSGLPLESESIEVNLTQAGSYKIQAKVSSSGPWFGDSNVPESYATSQVTTIKAQKAIYYAQLQSLRSNQISLQYNSTYNASISFSGSSVFLNATVVNNIAGIQLPDWLQTLVGISYPWYGIQLNDSVSSKIVYTGFVEQLEGSTFISSVMPSGTPTTPSGLICSSSSSCYEFSVTLNSLSQRALLCDLITALFIAMGLKVSDLLSEAGPFINYIVNVIIGQAQALATDFASKSAFQISSALMEFLSDTFWSIMDSLQYVVPPLLARLGVSAGTAIGWGVTLTNFAKVADWWKLMADVGFDLGAFIGVVIGQGLANDVQTFDFFSLNANSAKIPAILQDVLMVAPIYSEWYRLAR